ncbi:hypothetical protein Taqua_01832 [Tepidimonas aquatica]|uniref:Uncharacterized protein n=1 Tax=Tepidimonas aquatica TaxID=247482 RepID=A0A554WHP9_9BURK|nr:hypothetical protein Taqua_01832 [Tepidimonas aquatica]
MVVVMRHTEVGREGQSTTYDPSGQCRGELGLRP